MAELCWVDRAYGAVRIEDPLVLELIASPTFQRLKGIRQAGPSALVFPYKTVTRFEHCLGVYLLLGRLGADRREQVAGLLHDISHTAFSHAVDFLYTSDEQDHHERLKPSILNRLDLAGPLAGLGFEPRDFYDDAVYPLLEQPLPWLCADRLDYFFRDSLAGGVSTPESVARILDSLVVIDRVIALRDRGAAQDTARRFALMNQEYWASQAEAYIYNEFADALREAFRLGELSDALMMTDDATVLARLEVSQSPLVRRKLANVRQFHPEMLAGFTPRVIPKERWLDPPVEVEPGRWLRLSELDRAVSGSGAAAAAADSAGR